MRFLLLASIAALAPWSAVARTDVLVLRDGLRSEYAFCPEDERGGWGERHPAVWMFRAGLLGHSRRFERYLAPSPGVKVLTIDLERDGDELSLDGVEVVVCDGVRAAVLAPVAERLVRFVEEGGSLVVVAGFEGLGGQPPNERFSMTKRPSDYRSTALAAVLPVEITASPDYVVNRRARVEFDPRSPLGAGLHPDEWPLFGYHKTRARPTAQTLATIDGWPLVAWHAVGRGFLVVFTGSELETAYVRPSADPWPEEAVFWQRMVALVLGVLEVGVSLEAAQGEAVSLEAELRNHAAESRRLTLEAAIEDLHGVRWRLANRQRLRLAPGATTTWKGRAALDALPPGRYRASVLATGRGEGALFGATAPLVVEPPPGVKVGIEMPESVRRGTTARGRVRVEGARGAELRVVRGGRPLATLKLQPGTTPLEVHTGGLRPGRYELWVVAHRPLASKPLYVADYNPHFQNLMWWGQGDYPDGSLMRRLMVRDLLRHHVGAAAPIAVCERHGIWSMPTTGGLRALSRFAGASEKPESRWQDASGRRGSTLCPNDPLFGQALGRWADGLANDYRKLHSLRLIHIEDEASAPDCYCEDCRRLFEAEYGYRMPRPRKDYSPGFLDMWVQRMEFKLRSFGRYHKAIRDAFHARLPDALVLTSLPQGFTVAAGEDVVDHQRYLDAFWEHTYPGTEPLGAALTAHRVEMARELLGARSRPFIHLLQGFDYVAGVPKMPPRDYIRLIAWMSLAHGADHIGWFVYRWMWWLMPGTEAWEAVGEMGGLFEKLAPTLSRLRPARYPIALLYPLSQECVDYLRELTSSEEELPQRAVWRWRTWHAFQEAYFALKFAHLPFEPLYEEAVAAGKLPYQAVVVPHASHLRASVRKALANYIADGGAVFLGASSTLELPGARRLPFDFFTLFETYFPAGRRGAWQARRVRAYWLEAVLGKAERLKTILAPFHSGPLAISEPQVVWNIRHGGRAAYLFLINDTTTNPMSDAQRRMRGRFAHFAIMPMAFHPVRALCALKGRRVLYDAVAHRRVPATFEGDQTRFEIEIPGGDARLLAILPEAIEEVEATADRQVAAGEPLAFEVVVKGREAALDAVVPVEVRLEADAQERSAYVATEDGKAKGRLSTDIGLPPGRARLTARELLSGRACHLSVEITPPGGPLVARPAAR